MGGGRGRWGLDLLLFHFANVVNFLGVEINSLNLSCEFFYRGYGVFGISSSPYSLKSMPTYDFFSWHSGKSYDYDFSASEVTLINIKLLQWREMSFMGFLFSENWLSVQQLMANIKGNIKTLHYWSCGRGTTGDWWIPLAKASNGKSDFMSWHHYGWISKHKKHNQLPFMDSSVRNPWEWPWAIVPIKALD